MSDQSREKKITVVDVLANSELKNELLRQGVYFQKVTFNTHQFFDQCGELKVEKSVGSTSKDIEYTGIVPQSLSGFSSANGSGAASFDNDTYQYKLPLHSQPEIASLSNQFNDTLGSSSETSGTQTPERAISSRTSSAPTKSPCWHNNQSPLPAYSASPNKSWQSPSRSINSSSWRQESPPVHTRHYSNQKYSLFSKFDHGIKIDPGSWYTVTPEMLAWHQAREVKAGIGLELCCGVGGNLIAMAQHAQHVFGIECDSERISMARHNAAIYGVQHKITFIHGSLFQAPLIADIRGADVVFMSPPWGGPNYKHLQFVHLTQPVFDTGETLADSILVGLSILPPRGCLQVFLPRNLELHQLATFKNDVNRGEYESVPRGSRFSVRVEPAIYRCKGSGSMNKTASPYVSYDQPGTFSLCKGVTVYFDRVDHIEGEGGQ